MSEDVEPMPNFDEEMVVRAWNRDPTLRRLYRACKEAQLEDIRLEGGVGYRAPGGTYPQRTPEPPSAWAQRTARLEQACRELSEYCQDNGLPDLSKHPG